MVQSQEENGRLKSRVEELELRLSQLENNKMRQSLKDAQLLDGIVNGEANP